jgi:hypothetical protein
MDKPRFLDSAEWQSIKRQGDSAIKRWIDDNMYGSSVTAVLIGTETCQRPWVRYEVKKSLNEGKGILGIFIHNIKDSDQSTDSKGYVDLENIFSDYQDRQLFNNRFRTYDWKNDNGYDNVEEWIERAAREAGK